MWWMRLALAFGCSVRECKQRIDTAEFFLWRAFLELEPIGPMAENWQTATLTALTANVHKDARAKDRNALDFMPAAKTAKGTAKFRPDDELADRMRMLAGKKRKNRG